MIYISMRITEQILELESIRKHAREVIKRLCVVQNCFLFITTLVHTTISFQMIISPNLPFVYTNLAFSLIFSLTYHFHTNLSFTLTLVQTDLFLTPTARSQLPLVQINNSLTLNTLLH